MWGHNHQAVPAALFEGFKNKTAAQEAADAFKSALIIAYEQALQNGLSPYAALSAMLDWVCAEFERCRQDAGD